MQTMDDVKNTTPMSGLKEKIMRRFRIFGDLLGFLWNQKMWWFIPMVVVLGTLAILAVGAGVSGIAPTIYVLF